MKSAFPGFPQEGIDFFRKLQRNNRREWFQPRKATFDETLKLPMRELVAALNDSMKKFAPEYITDPGQGDLPDLSRHPLQQRQDALQESHCCFVPAAGNSRRRRLLRCGLA